VKTNVCRNVFLAWLWPLVICLAGLVAAQGCREVKIPNGRLLCSPQNTCPRPYQCLADHCWAPGTGPGDGGVDGTSPDGGTSDVPKSDAGDAGRTDAKPSTDATADMSLPGDAGPGSVEQGGACVSDGQCVSGHCADQICCDKACDGLCVSCAGVFTGGKDGVCAPALAGMNAHPTRDCLTSAAEPCGNDGTCNGAGACRLQGSTQVCAPSACSGATGAQSFQPAASCDGTGKCISPAKQSCAAYDCSTTNGCAKPCTTDMSCGDGNFCGTDAICRAKKTDGAACTAANECAHGFCVDGFCCESDCTKKGCFSCARSNTGQADGKCAPVSRGKASPRATDCKAAADPKTCGLDGLCDGAGACESYGPTTTCADATCTGSKFTAAATCDGAGKCGVATTTDCGSFQCAVTGCRTKCTLDTDCSTSSYCAADGTCAAKITNGTACTAAKQCSSGACVDGVCCNSACTGSCMSCLKADTGMNDGTCAQIKSGTKSATDCPTDTTTCGRDGTCNGAGACTYKASGTSCGAAMCTGSTLQAAPACDGKGTCAPGASSSCMYGCQSGTPACATSCPAGQKICNGGCISNSACCGGCTGGKQCINGACGCQPKSPSNLLNNPGFDGSLSSWTLLNPDPSNPATAYSTTDAASCTGSGSAHVAGLVGELHQCQNTVNSGPVYFGFLFKPDGAGGSFGGWGYCGITFYSTFNCMTESTTPGIAVEGTPPSGGGAWGAGVGSATATSDVLSVSISCSAPGGSGWYDDIYLTMAPNTGY